MADRYQDRPFPAGDDKGDSDPLAELARLIGQTDPFASMGRANPKVQPRGAPAPDPYPREPQPPPEDGLPAGPPPWMQRANRPEIKRPVYDEQELEPEPEQDYEPSPVHPLQRYVAQHQRQAPQEDFPPEPYDEAAGEVDPSRYDEALYGQIESGAQDYQREPVYPDDPYAYQDGYEEENQGEKRRGGVVTVIAVLALAVIGTGAAFAYRSYVGSGRSGDPPIIKADNSPTKIVPSPGDGTSKTPDRMPAGGEGAEKMVPREEAPVDISGKAGSGPRVVFPPLNPNGNPPSAASVAPNNAPVASAGPTPTNGTVPNNEPRKIRTFSVRGDQADATGAPAAAAPPPPGTKPAPAPKTAARTAPPSSANASANAPLSLSPQAAPADPAPATDTRTRVAATNPTQAAPEPASPAASGGGAFLVQVSSQPSEAIAQSSFRALQGKFPSVLGSQTPVIKRADLGEKGVVYRAMVGPFGSRDEAVKFCESLKSAGGQCFVPKN
jgi:SPOR domain